MKDFKLNCFLLLFLLPYFAIGQNTDIKGISLSYYGNIITNPGFRLAYETPFKHWHKSKERRGKIKTKDKYLMANFSVTAYRHPQNHYGLIILPEFIFRRVLTKGFMTELALGLGYHQSFVDGITYSVETDGSVTEKKFNGQGTFYSELTFGVGKDMRRKKLKPFSWRAAFGLSGRYPYDHIFLPSIICKLGVTYYPSFNKNTKNEK